MSVTLAMDIGGTHMRAAVFPKNKTKPSHQIRIRTRVKGETPLQRLLKLIHEVTPEGETIDSVGIAIPGLFDPHEGIIITAPNIPEWAGVPITGMIQEEIGAPTYMGNDANLAALGEWGFGAGKGHHDLIYLTVSTGIGGGIISNDKLLVGHRGLGAELGHVTILPDGPLCSCGKRGHIEAISSGTGIANYVEEQIKSGRTSKLTGEPDAKAISIAALAGDPLANEAFERAGLYLGMMIANYLAIFDPSIIIIGGGVSQTGELLLAPTRKSVENSVFSQRYLQDLTITGAALGDDAGLYGAFLLADNSPKK